MSFIPRLKGKITQSVLESLLAHVKYRVVPLGIEEVVRDVTTLSGEKYAELNLSTTLRNLPDYFVAKSDLKKTWLVEVKYRNRWSPTVIEWLGKTLYEQVLQWQPLHLVLFLGEAAQITGTPASRLGVCKMVVNDNGELGILRRVNQHQELFHPWNEMTWALMSRFQDVFEEVAEQSESTLATAISALKLEELDEAA